MPLVPCMAKELQPRSLTASTSALANNEATIGFVHHVTLNHDSRQMLATFDILEPQHTPANNFFLPLLHLVCGSNKNLGPKYLFEITIIFNEKCL